MEYDLTELAIIYDTIEFLYNTYHIKVSELQYAKDISHAKHLLNLEIYKLLQVITDQKQINTLIKYILV